MHLHPQAVSVSLAAAWLDDVSDMIVYKCLGLGFLSRTSSAVPWQQCIYMVLVLFPRHSTPAAAALEAPPACGVADSVTKKHSVPCFRDC